jgi:hypothetical protein
VEREKGGFASRKKNNGEKKRIVPISALSNEMRGVGVQTISLIYFKLNIKFWIILFDFSVQKF